MKSRNYYKKSFTQRSRGVQLVYQEKRHNSSCSSSSNSTDNLYQNHKGPALKPSKEQKTLLIFDMDHTIIDLNTDVELIKILKEKCPETLSKVPRLDNWAHYMNDIMHLMSKEGFSIAEVKKIIQSLEYNIGFKDLFDFISDNKHRFEVIIFSGCNTVFLEWILESKKIENLIFKVYSNIAKITQAGVLTVDSTHVHDCSSCDKSQCKQVLLQDFLNQQRNKNVSYRNLVFVGDGVNDFCLTKILTKDDLVCYRIGFELEKKITEWKKCNNLDDYNCHLLPWKTGFEIVDKLKNMI